MSSEQDFVRSAKQELWRRLDGHAWAQGQEADRNLQGSLGEAERDVKTKLHMAFENRVSTSLIVVGPEGSGKNFVVESVLASLKREQSKDKQEDDENGLSIARVRGQVNSDHHALCFIAYQLCKRESKDRNVVVALEDLEEHFKLCHHNGTPAVIVLEDIDIFATREKQVLIYTLLDFMHRKDQLLVVVGTTARAHLPTLLEKRTASRLNAQFVYVAPPTGKDMCQILSMCLTLSLVRKNEGEEETERE